MRGKWIHIKTMLNKTQEDASWSVHRCTSSKEIVTINMLHTGRFWCACATYQAQNAPCAEWNDLLHCQVHFCTVIWSDSSSHNAPLKHSAAALRESQELIPTLEMIMMVMAVVAITTGNTIAKRKKKYTAERIVYWTRTPTVHNADLSFLFTGKQRTC